MGTLLLSPVFGEKWYFCEWFSRLFSHARERKEQREGEKARYVVLSVLNASEFYYEQ